MDKHLFLNGGRPPFTPGLAARFAEKTSLIAGPISILFVEREGWEEYMPFYTQELVDSGCSDFNYIPLPFTSIEKAAECIRTSSGLIIAGGDTNLYADLIVETAISTAIKKRYETGMPVAGFSAGALICPETCIISAKDNEAHTFQWRKGLGLFPDLLLSVHFTQWNDEDHLREAVGRFGSGRSSNYGIDVGACVYLLNGQLEAVEGNGVYTVHNGSLRQIY